VGVLRRKILLLVGVLCGAVTAMTIGLLVPALALASQGGPAWVLESTAMPTVFELNGAKDAYFIVATNTGSATSSGEVRVEDHLPHGVTVANPVPRAYFDVPSSGPGTESESGPRQPCTWSEAVVICRTTEPIPPGGILTLRVFVTLSGGIEGQLPANSGTLSEIGGAGAASVELHEASPPIIGTSPASAGATVTSTVTSLSGTGQVHAGEHPASILTNVKYNTTYFDSPAQFEEYLPIAAPRTQIVDLPAGLVGDARALPACSGAELAAEDCPADTQVGAVAVVHSEVDHTYDRKLYNITPEGNTPAEFGFALVKTVVLLKTRLLPSAGGYVLSVSVPTTPVSEAVKIAGAQTEFFGFPNAVNGLTAAGGLGDALLTVPVDCGATRLDALWEADFWELPTFWVANETPVFDDSSGEAITSCQSVPFDPSVAVAPIGMTAQDSDSPAGVQLQLTMRNEEESLTSSSAIAPSDVKDAVVRFPAGLSISPSAANGLAACPASGPEGIDLGRDDLLSDHNQVQEGEVLGDDELVHPAPGHCPLASQIGEAEVTSPLVAQPLKGHVYIASPNCGEADQSACTSMSAEDGQLFGLWLELAGDGIVIKLPGEVSVNPATGQITTRFAETPQLPFATLKVKLNDGPDAPLATPQSCGTFNTTVDLTPWSTPYIADANVATPFSITSCSGGFAPSFSAGTTSPAGGAFTPFTTTFSRHDGEQYLSGVSVTLPSGLLGKIAGVGQCGEAEVKAAEANTGGCPESSRLGTVTAAAGAGSEPFWQSGNVYLTGPYDGAPFGLVIVVPANAGPYHLGNIVVRARIEINPSTAQVMTISNPLPQMIDGIPLRIQTVNVTLSREGFVFNATNCGHQQITGTITSAQGTQAAVSTGYASSGCGSLPFKPVFSASTNGKTSKQDGASLSVRITKQAGEANIAKVDLTIPDQLPSRLTTLQKACTEAQFNANPAGCPSASDIATATVHTPLLNAPLTGPVFFVSHGGAAFPDVEMVLQAEGVKLIVDGHTQIKNGVTYSRFETVPDAPFTSFEFVAPQGPYSIFSANGSLCSPTKTEKDKTKVTARAKNGRTRKVTRTVTKTVPATLEMPTEITGQNGTVMKQNTKIAVTDCPAVKGSAKNKNVKHRAAKASGGGR
jgi:hypothetical protein